jgi:hypothetical protein
MNEENVFQIVLVVCIMFLFGFGILYREPVAYSIAKGELLSASKQYDALVMPYLSNCSQLQDDVQVRCMMDELRPIIKYNGTEKSLTILSPEKYLERGGTCKEIAAIYASAFRQLNWTRVDFRSPVPRHMSITIARAIDNSTWIYCDVEMNRANCIKVQNTLW